MSDQGNEKDTGVDPPRYVVGIDLGTTNSAVAFVDTWQRGHPVKCFPVPQLTAPATVEARETLPSCTYIPAPGEFGGDALALPWSHDVSTIIGRMAVDHGTMNPARFIVSAKSWLCHSGVDRTSDLLPWQGASDVSKQSPTQACAGILRHVRSAWNHAHPGAELDEQEVIVTVPASFDEVARDLTGRAARAAGYKRFRLIEEPLAAFYSWLDRHPESAVRAVQPGQSILVCDIGGGTTDFTLIRATDDPSLKFRRVAVGKHLILGGDNLDLALAHHVETKFGVQLPPDQWSVLVRQSCRAKEALLGNDPPESWTLHIAGRGTKLIGGSTRFELTRDEVLKVLVDGFLPRVSLSDKPATRGSGFREFGLPYAPDPAVTRHLADFLSVHGDETGGPVRPDLILLNGGFFYATALRERLLEVVQSWFSDGSAARWEPTVLVNDRPDLAVALGAAAYGIAKRGHATAVDAGLGRAYYIGIDDPRGAHSAVCVAPAHLQEGQGVELSDQQFNLLLRQPVEFPIYVSTTRTRDRAGEVVEYNPEELQALPPIRAVLKARGQGAGEPDRIPVRLAVRLSELGALEIWCREVDSARRWRLQFDVRVAADSQPGSVAADANADAAGAAPASLLDEDVIARCVKEIAATFETSDGRSASPADLIKRIEAAAGQGREEWPRSMLRTIWQSLLDHGAGRRRGVVHEARWLNLCGFALRPGRGVPLDDWRVNQTWRIQGDGTAFPKNEACRAEWWILWRRIAAGLSPIQQRNLSGPPTSELRALVERRKSRLRNAPHEQSEIWRLLGALEWIEPDRKTWIGDSALAVLQAEGVDHLHGAPLWCLARVGARVPTHGPLNHVVPVQTVENWIHKILAVGKDHAAIGFALMQLARRTGDRFRDISETHRSGVLDWLRSHDVPAHYGDLVEAEGALRDDEQTLVFGESLPIGLTLTPRE